MRLKSAIVILLSLIFFTACGYKPAVNYAKQEIKGKVFVDLHVNIEDPKNSVLIKDAMIELLVQKLGRKLVDKKSLADTIVDVKLNSISFSTLQYDNDGYIKLYEANASINVKYDNKVKTKSFNVSGNHDFSIEDGGTISESKKFEATKEAASKALDAVIAKLAILSFEKDTKK